MATNTGLLASTTSTKAPTTTAQPKTDWSKQIGTLYQNSLGRAPDASGAAYWQSRLDGGASLTQVQKEIAGSDEATAINASKSNFTKPAASGSNAASMTTSATATGYTPTMQNVSGESLSQNQLASITSAGSPLMTQASTAGAKAANKRGLLSSSIGVGAAQDSVIRAATPLAQQDASTYANRDSANAQFQNASDQFLAGAKNSASLANASATNQMQQTLTQADLQRELAKIQADTSLSVADKQIASQQLISNNQIKSNETISGNQLNSQQTIADKQIASQQAISGQDNATKLQLQQIDSDVKKSLANMDTEAKAKLAQVDADNKQLLQTNISAANAYAQLAQQMAAISTSTTMDAAAKQQATDNQLNIFRANLDAIGKVSGLNLSQYFQPVSTSAQGGTGAAAQP